MIFCTLIKYSLVNANITLSSTNIYNILFTIFGLSNCIILFSFMHFSYICLSLSVNFIAYFFFRFNCFNFYTFRNLDLINHTHRWKLILQKDLIIWFETPIFINLCSEVNFFGL
jgi:hypothetical protein